MNRLSIGLAIAATTVGCGEGAMEQTTPAPETSDAGGCGAGTLNVDGVCQAAGLPSPARECAPGEAVLTGGGCLPAGVPPDQCSAGFAPEGDGCAPLLPDVPCLGPTRAALGETTCVPIGSCGAEAYGALPSGATPQYVDASYAGADSDGSIAKPWTTIQQAVDAAEPGGVVAIAAGTYAEDVVIVDKPARLYGRCPELVAIVAVGAQPSAVFISTGADGSEVHGLALTGAARGIAVSGSNDISIEDVWIHETANFGVHIGADLGPTSATLRRTVVSTAKGLGIYVAGSRLTVEDSTIRATRTDDAGGYGRGISIEPITERAELLVHSSIIAGNYESAVYVAESDAIIEASLITGTKPQPAGDFGEGVYLVAGNVEATLVLRGSVVSDNHGEGVLAIGARALIDASVVRDTAPSSMSAGRGINAASFNGLRSQVNIGRSVIAGNTQAGVYAGESDLAISGTIVRDTHPTADGAFGRGVALEGDETGRATGVIHASVVAGNHEAGIFVGIADAMVDGTAVRDTEPREADGAAGRGINVQDNATVGVRWSLVENNRDVGIVVGLGSSATIDASVVRGTRSAPGTYDSGAGIGVQDGRVSITSSLIEDNGGFGVLALSSDATLTSVLVRRTTPVDAGYFGDGILVGTTTTRGTVSVSGCRVESSARAGISNFSASASVASTLLACNSINLDGERDGRPLFAVEDRGNNTCRCKAVEACVVLSSSLGAPSALQF